MAQRRRVLAIAMASAMTLASLLPVAWLEARPRDGTEVAIIFAPWLTRESAAALAIAAGGYLVREGALQSIIVARGEDRGFIERLYAMGAWAVIDPAAFGGCLSRRVGRSE
jgi:hypothetical protein